MALPNHYNKRKTVPGTPFKEHDYYFKMKVLSPLHISDTNPWMVDFDYIYDTKTETAVIFDFDDYLNKLDIDFLRVTDRIDIFREKTKEMLAQNRLKILKRYPLPRGKSHIHPFISDIQSPLIPGSSVKGAIRTAILSQYMRNDLNSREDGVNFEDAFKQKVGEKKDNIKMTMDSIRVTDLPFNDDHLKLIHFGTYSLKKVETKNEIKQQSEHSLFTLSTKLSIADKKSEVKKEKKPEIKPERQNKPVTEFVEKTENERFAESIIPGTVLKEILAIRTYFRVNDEDKTRFKGMKELIDFSGSLREHYKIWISQELRFLNTHDSEEIRHVIVFYEELLKKLNSGAVLLNFGFGTGWSGKTGTMLSQNRELWGLNLMDYLKSIKNPNARKAHLFNNILTNVRYLKCPKGHFPLNTWFCTDTKELQLKCHTCGKEYSIDELLELHPFPKSRKFARFEGRLYPPGWVELIPGEKKS